MQEQACLLGLEAVTGRTIRFQGALVIFALVFHLATGTGEVPGEHLGAGLLPIRHNKARVDALFGPLDLDDHPARARPCGRLVARRVKASSLAPPTRRGPLGLLDDFVGQLLQHRVAREACDRAQVGVRFDPRPHLGRGDVAVTTQEDQRIGPRMSKPLDHALASRQHVGAAEAFGLENRGDQPSREAFIQVAWHATITAIIALVADLFLCTMGAVCGVIDLEDDDFGWAVVGRETLISQHQRPAGQLGA